MAPERSLVERRTVVELWTVGLLRQLAVYDRTRMNGSTAAQRQPNRTRTPTAAAKDRDRRSRTLRRSPGTTICRTTRQM